jgi:hypothetical protein
MTKICTKTFLWLLSRERKVANYCGNSQRLTDGDTPTSGLWSPIKGVIGRFQCFQGAQNWQKIGLNWENSKVFSFQLFSRAGEGFSYDETTPPFTKVGPKWFNFHFVTNFSLICEILIRNSVPGLSLSRVEIFFNNFN